MAPPVPSVMPFWNSYQRCMATTDPNLLVRSVEDLDRSVLEGSEPPDWLKSWGDHVIRQPLRTAVDPQALGAACTLRTARVLAEQDHAAEARSLYERLLIRYPQPQLTYYHDQAREALASLPQNDPAVVAFRVSLSRAQ
jgi:hypothetical protein